MGKSLDRYLNARIKSLSRLVGKPRLRRSQIERGADIAEDLLAFFIMLEGYGPDAQDAVSRLCSVRSREYFNDKQELSDLAIQITKFVNLSHNRHHGKAMRMRVLKNAEAMVALLRKDLEVEEGRE